MADSNACLKLVCPQHGTCGYILELKQGICLKSRGCIWRHDEVAGLHHFQDAQVGPVCDVTQSHI